MLAYIGVPYVFFLFSVCRALGIPSRSVTTYASAHDTQSSLTVDYFVDEEGEVMEELNSDSIWYIF
jgi:transglutaminase 1